MYIRYFTKSGSAHFVSKKPVPRNYFLTRFVHGDLVYDVNVIDVEYDAFVIFSTQPVDGSVYIYWKDNEIEGAMTFPIDGVDYSSYYMTKLVKNRRIIAGDVAYQAKHTVIPCDAFFLKFGPVSKEMAAVDLNRVGLSLSSRKPWI